MVARFVRDEEAVGSNPATPTMVWRFKAKHVAIVGAVRSRPGDLPTE